MTMKNKDEVASQPTAAVSDEQIAETFHAEYERLAPSFGYETCPESRKTWAGVPPENKALMIAVAHNVRALLSHPAVQQPAPAVSEVRTSLNAMQNLGVVLNDRDSAALETLCDFVAAALSAPVAQPSETAIQDVMYEVFKYAKISDGIASTEGADREHQRDGMLQQDRKIRAMLRSLLRPAAQEADEQCWCDRNNIGEPGVSCGDCPTRDYKRHATQEVAREQPAQSNCGACPDDFGKSAYCTTCPEQPAKGENT